MTEYTVRQRGIFLIKRHIIFLGSLLLISLLIFSFASCSKVEVAEGEIVAVFRYGDTDITQILSDKDSETVRNIFGGKTMFSDSLSCGFSENVALVVERYNQLVGIRYFSCASVKASEMGFNYVFPASGKQTKDSFCPTLSRAFKLTKPYFLHEYSDIVFCEDALRKDNNLGFI